MWHSLDNTGKGASQGRGRQISVGAVARETHGRGGCVQAELGRQRYASILC